MWFFIGKIIPAFIRLKAFNLLNLIPWPYRLLIVVVVLVGAGAFGYFTLQKHYDKVCNSRLREATEELQNVADRRASKQREQHEELVNKLNQEKITLAQEIARYEREDPAVKCNYLKRGTVRVLNTKRGKLPATSDLDDAAATSPSTISKRALAEQCARDSLQYREISDRYLQLIKWIEENLSANKTEPP